MEKIPFESEANLFPTNNFENPPLVYTKSGVMSFGTDAYMREENQDKLFVDLEKDAFAVADGMGGHRGGEKAAEIVVESLAHGLSQNIALGQMQINMWQRMKKENFPDGGAVYVAAKIEGKNLKVWYAGDAELMVINGKGEIKFGTKRTALRDAPSGMHSGITHMESVELSNYDRIIAASDGLWDNIVLPEVIQATKDLPVDKAVYEIQRAAGRGMVGGRSDGDYGNKDNLTIILYEILPVPLRQKV